MSTNDDSQRNSRNKEVENDIVENNEFCNDCLYHWCTTRGNVTYCNMKSKGLFECRSCMLKIMNAYDKELLLEKEAKITTKGKITLTI